MAPNPSFVPASDAAFSQSPVPSRVHRHALPSAGLKGLVPAVAAVCLLAFFWDSPDWPYVASLLIVTFGAAIASTLAPYLAPSRKASPHGLEDSGVVAVMLAALTGLAWGAVPMALVQRSDADHRLIILALVVVVLIDVQRIGRIAWAGPSYVVPICIGGAIGFGFSGTAVGLALAVVIPAYGWFLLSRCVRDNVAAASQIADKLNIAEQNSVIHDLLLDFDEHTSDWLWRTDSAGRFADVSFGAGGHLAPTSDDMIGAKIETIFAHKGATVETSGPRAVLAAFAGRKPFRNKLVEIPIDGTSRRWRISGKPIFDATGLFSGFRGVGSDVTGAHESESRIAQLVNYDSLTGFANRANFRIFLGHQCAAAAKDGHCRALLCLDIDGFKSVNDRLGHEGGDEVLRQVAQRLTAAAPTDTFIARLDGDEFAIWLQRTTPVKAEAAARVLIEALNVPFDIQGFQVDIGASVGIVYAPKHTLDPDDLLVKADLALYRAKAENKGQICVFAPIFESALIERRKLEGDLKLALARGEFVLYYQPILDVSLGRVVSFEALIRWQAPDRGFVSPADFIPLAETSGLIVPIGRWVLFEACRAAASWPRDIHVAVNISPPHLRSPEFLQDVVLALKASGLHPSRLEIEVTEGVLFDKSIAALDTMRLLRQRGVRIALDDFGTGYSSFNYLIDFPVDKIKIDRSFVDNFIESHKSRAIIDAILGLARTLSIKVTAEGVETKEQALALKQRRCEEMQGYLLSRPRPGADVPDIIASVPGIFREAIPTYMDSPLAMALVGKKSALG